MYFLFCALFVGTSDNYQADSLVQRSPQYLKKNGSETSNFCNAGGDRRALFRLLPLRPGAFFHAAKVR